MELKTVRQISEVAEGAWDALVGNDDPFVEHAFLAALESSGSVGRGTGWDPTHLLAYEGDSLVGALPLYAKGDSWGEFIFDFQWARAAQSAGIRYYPKLVAMVPYTPATGRRFLARDEDLARVVPFLLEGAIELATAHRCSSVHLLYLNETERTIVADTGHFAARTSLQFHWENEGYADFDAYLASFRAPSRKQVRKERRTVAESGARVRVIEGPDLGDKEWRALEVFYRMNVARHGSAAYLTPGFFAALRTNKKLASRVVACIAFDASDEPIGGSLNFEKGKRLYGRYWGTTSDQEMLHFECCYYQLIERAITRGLSHFEAGAQGHHKLKRGLLPAPIHSAHWIADTRLRAGIEAYLPEEAQAVRHEMAMMAAEGPFKRGGDV